MQRRRLINYPTAERAKDTHHEVQGQNKNSIINHEVIVLLWLDGGQKNVIKSVFDIEMLNNVLKKSYLYLFSNACVTNMIIFLRNISWLINQVSV